MGTRIHRLSIVVGWIEASKHVCPGNRWESERQTHDEAPMQVSSKQIDRPETTNEITTIPIRIEPGNFGLGLRIITVHNQVMLHVKAIMLW